MRWFKNLKRWQKGGLIGLGVGLIFAGILLIDPISGIPRREWGLGEWVGNFHFAFYILSAYLVILPACLAGILSCELGGTAFECAGLAAIVICYGGLGALFGRFQQLSKPVWKWLLTGLLALFLLGLYFFGYFFWILNS